jgi:hypothetical protein
MVRNQVFFRRSHFSDTVIAVVTENLSPVHDCAGSNKGPRPENPYHVTGLCDQSGSFLKSLA